MAKHKDELSLRYFQKRCQELEDELKESGSINKQLEADNKALKNMLDECAERAKKLEAKYNGLIKRFEIMFNEVASYRENHDAIIKEAHIVSDRYKSEMKALKGLYQRQT